MRHRRCCATIGCCWRAAASPRSRPTRPRADQVFDRPGRFVLPGLLNLHNHCFSEAVARTHTEDGNGRTNSGSIVYTVLLPLTKRGIEILSPAERLAIARLGILQLLQRWRHHGHGAVPQRHSGDVRRRGGDGAAVLRGALPVLDRGRAGRAGRDGALRRR